MPLSRLILLVLSFACPLFFSGAAQALGLSELRGSAILGQVFQARIEILGLGGQSLDGACFRLARSGVDDGIPVLSRAALTVRANMLEIRSDLPIREPVFKIALQVMCGHELSREYIVLSSPPVLSEPEAAVLPARKQGVVERTEARSAKEMLRPVPVAQPEASPAQPKTRPKRSPENKDTVIEPVKDRLVLYSGVREGGDLTLQISSLLDEARLLNEENSAKRDLLRLEFRMLLALHEQANSQLEMAEKLREMQSTLGDLKSLTSDKAGDAPRVQAPQSTVTVPPPPRPQTVPISPVKPQTTGGDFSEWLFYGLLLGMLFGGGGWVLWRFYQSRAERDPVFDDVQIPVVEIEPEAPPKLDDSEVLTVDLHFEPAEDSGPSALDIDLGQIDAHPMTPLLDPLMPEEASLDSPPSPESAELEQRVEANPVMELAEIMLSFGRVKGAAQALQEYIDHSPQEALQPWIRLMDVYRLAGMREEFESVALNLNKNFNVEVQSWEEADAPSVDLLLDQPGIADVATSKRAACLEEMPRIIAVIQSLWADGDVVGYLHQLLRDNRGGQRVGFSLPVVEEVLFLIDLRNTIDRIEEEKEESES